MSEKNNQTNGTMGVTKMKTTKEKKINKATLCGWKWWIFHCTHTHTERIIEFVIQMISDFQFSVRSTILSCSSFVLYIVAHSTAACISCSGMAWHDMAAPPPSLDSPSWNVLFYASKALTHAYCLPPLYHSMSVSLLFFCLSAFQFGCQERESFVWHIINSIRVYSRQSTAKINACRIIFQTYTHTIRNAILFFFSSFSWHILFEGSL